MKLNIKNHKNIASTNGNEIFLDRENQRIEITITKGAKCKIWEKL